LAIIKGDNPNGGYFIYLPANLTVMSTIKILVNWKTKKIIHCEYHRGSKEYQAILDQGYIEVGSFKARWDEGLPPKIFWNSDYFEPDAKYGQKPNG
jgi:hypothetical protein